MPDMMFLFVLCLGSFRCISGIDLNRLQDIQDSGLTISMPGVITPGPEMYMCTSIRVPQETHIIGFKAKKAKQSTVHHMLLYGCSNPGSSSPVWLCGHDGSGVGNFSHASVCGGDQRALYAWARDADELKLPEGVGFTVGVDGINSLVLQVHYAVARPEHDFTGVIMTTTPDAPEKHAGVLLLGSGESIPPMQTSYLNMSCEMKEDVTFHPFAFRTHAHNLSPVISGYRVRENVWTLIGKMNPHKPQMFYNVETEGMEIKKGDVVAARCTMVNTKSKRVYMGPTNEDEMCNFYIMYWTQESLLSKTDCWGGGWKHLKNQPQDASTYIETS